MPTRIRLKDYKIIKSGDVVVNGITFISAKNCSGKSTLLRALKTTLENSSSDTCYRHGTNAFTVDVDIDGTQIHYGRSDGVPWVSFNAEPQKTKLGHSTLAQLEPRFPLKRIDYVDSHFIPNIAEQNKVPVFSDISVVDLFSTLFASMSKLSQRGTDLKKDVSKLTANRDTIGANLDFTKANKLQFESSIATTAQQYPTLESDYARLVEIHSKKLKYAELTQKVSQLAQRFSDPVKQSMVSQVESARDIFPLYQFTQQLTAFLSSKDLLKNTLSKAQTELSRIPESSVLDLVSLVGPLVVAKRRYTSLSKALISYPPELDLFGIMGDIRRLKKSVKDYYIALAQVDTELKDLNESLAQVGCPLLAQGLCPQRLKSA